ncbi:MAG: YceI family protein [Chloroflexi bacterium]|nr:YceI family protein [Chloroflexota bacterium]
MRTGLIAGSIAAMVAALASLPLRSPSDPLLNSATVAVGALTVGLAAGMIWNRLAETRRPLLYFYCVLAGGLAAVMLLAAAAEPQIDRAFTFSAPLATIAFVMAGAIVPALERTSWTRRRWPVPAAVVIALGIGIGLAGQGDAASGELSLPPAAAGPVAAATTTPAPSDGGTYVVGEGSQATFTVREQLARLPLPNDAVVRTTSLAGEVDLDGGQSVVRIDLHTLSSDQAFRDGYIRRAMFPTSPIATVTVDALGSLPQSFFAGETLTRRVDGVLSIRGVEVPLTFEIEARHDGSVLYVLARTTFTWEQLQMPAPTAGPVVSVDDEVKVEILLQTFPQAATGG